MDEWQVDFLDSVKALKWKLTVIEQVFISVFICSNDLLEIKLSLEYFTFDTCLYCA